MNRTIISRAFTLIEIIVVTVILAALAALLYPVLARARESSRRTACISNLHQIGIALRMYRDDYDGMEAQQGVALSHSQLGLPYHFSMDVFYKQYVKNRSVLFCPSYTGPVDGIGSSYAMGMIDSELTDPSRDWEAAAALRGPDYPVAICTSHNGPDVPPDMRRSYEIMYYHVLRIEGRVDVKKAPFDAVLDYASW